MAASRSDVDRWIDSAKKQHSKFIISVCDTFDWDDYPVYCKDIDELLKEHENHNGVNMQRINEVIMINEDGTVKENLHINDNI